MADIYFDLTSGNDTTGDGSSGNPYQTLTKAHTQASDGDTLILKDGVHTLVAGSNLIMTKSVTITSESQDANLCVIDGVDLYYYAVQAPPNKSMTLSHITFTRLLIKNEQQVVRTRDRHGVTVDVNNCIFSYCLPGTPAAQDQILGGNAGGGGNNQIFTVNNCLFYENASLGALVGLSTTDTSTLNINNCTIFNSTNNIKSFAWQSLGIINMKNNIMYNNYISNTALVLWIINAGVLNFYNNCIYNIGLGNIYLAMAQTGVESIPDVDQNNIETDPLFVDAPNGDFRLRPSSPCIDTGTVL